MFVGNYVHQPQQASETLRLDQQRLLLSADQRSVTVNTILGVSSETDIGRFTPDD
jgi:hypothetical protein